ncbi:ATP-binding protein [Kitasatospora sp. NPDC002227]|uniref:ATP-binding protein n=1 Tax=Kitasatospora sp. NPDC002227 TaxID=3154773 RepID=UPI003328A6B4
MAAEKQLRVWQRAFEAAPGSVPAARREVRTVLCAWGWSETDRLAEVLLIFSELITNAVSHASKPGDLVRVRIEGGFDGCRLEVQDQRPDLALHIMADPDREHGRGLMLVREMAAEMDVNTTKESKIVWARVLRHQEAVA